MRHTMRSSHHLGKKASRVRIMGIAAERYATGVIRARTGVNKGILQMVGQ